MQIDSDIIHYTTLSLNNDSPFSNKKKFYLDVEDTESTRSFRLFKSFGTPSTATSVTGSSITTPTPSTTPSQSISLLSKVNRECRSFCCVFNFLTISSFKFYTVKIYLILLCLLALFTQMIQGGYLSAIITSLQTQFNLSTFKIGIILSSFDIMGIFATPLVSYVGSRHNKPRVIAICSFVYVLGAVVFTLPYYLSDKYTIVTYASLETTNGSNISTIDSKLCVLPMTNEHNNYLSTTAFDLSTTSTKSSNQTNAFECNRTSSKDWPYYLFILGQLLMSWGIAPLFSLGITYLCDNLDEEFHAMYTSIVYGAFALGPALGYLLASFLLSKWIYLNETPIIDDKDPRWVGCWFLGFIISGGCMIFVTILLISFPTIIKDTPSNQRLKSKMKKTQTEQTLISSQMDNKTGMTNNNANRSAASVGSNDLNKAVPARRKLHTIDEASESVIDQSFEFLDSISAKVPANFASAPTLATTPSVIISSDSLSNSMSTTTSTYLFQSTTTASSMTPTNEKPIIEFKKIKNKYFRCLIDRINSILVRTRDFFKSIIKLLINFRYTLLIVIMSVECVLIAVFTHYMILYSQNIYQISSSKSSILVGGVLVPSAIVGAIVGGLLVKKFNLDIEGCTRLIMLSSTIVVGGIFVLLFIRCEGTISAGIDPTLGGFNKKLELCNKDCNCDNSYIPTCGANKISYVSPCYAGCKFYNSSGYFDCGCIQPDEANNNNNNNNANMATHGACSRNCDTKLVIFLIVLFIVVASEATCLTPITILLLKLVDKQLQPLALGVEKMANILIAYIPSPIIFSHIIDKTCILWNNDCIGDDGTCLEYDTSYFHYALFGGAVGVKVFSCILLVIFSLHIHKSYVLKRNRKNIKLRHDPNKALSRKEKYRIDSIVASTDSAMSDIEIIQDRLRKLSSDRLRKINQQKAADSNRNNNDNNNKNDSTTNNFNNNNPIRNDIILKKYLVYEDDFSSLNLSQSSDYFLNLKKNSNQILDPNKLSINNTMNIQNDDVDSISRTNSITTNAAAATPDDNNESSSKINQTNNISPDDNNSIKEQEIVQKTTLV